MIGTIAFIITLFILVLVHEYGHFKVARFFKVGIEEFGFGFPPAIKKINRHGLIISLNWIPLGGFVRIKGEEGSDNSPDSFTSQSIYKRVLIIVAGVSMNLIVAILIFSAGFIFGMPQDVTRGIPKGAEVRDLDFVIAGIVPNSPAATVFERGESILSVDGKSFTELADLQHYIESKKGQDIIVAVKNESDVSFKVLKPVELNVGEGNSVVGLGVQLVATGIVSYPWYQAFFEGISFTAKTFGMIITTLGGAVFNLLRGSPAGIDVAGPFGIAVITGSVVKLGFLFLLQFVGLLSVNLAIVNLLPFPALDGGRLLFLIIEVIRRKPISHELEARIHGLGFIVLLLLIVVVTYVDFQRLAGYLNW